MVERLDKLEERIQKLEKEREHLINHLNELHLTIEAIQQTILPRETTESPNVKIQYLTAANEQMFNQNQRLRQYIEACLAKEDTLDQRGYLKALSGE